MLLTQSVVGLNCCCEGAVIVLLALLGVVVSAGRLAVDVFREVEREKEP